MNSKKIMKIGIALMIIATVLMAVNMVFATNSGFTDLGQRPNPTSTGVDSVSSVVGNVMGIVQYICYAAAVVLLVILGVKFMTSSPDAKAEVKKSAVIYIIGAVLVFAAGLILNILSSWANQAIH